MHGFMNVFVHLVYNSALFLASCCCSFLLHVVANQIFIFLLSRQMFLLSVLPKIFSFILWSRRVYPAVILRNLISIDVSRFYPYFPPLRVQISLPYKRMGRADILHTFIPQNFWTKFLFKSVVQNSQCNVHGSVHCNNILIHIQQEATLHSLFYLKTCTTVSS